MEGFDKNTTEQELTVKSRPAFENLPLRAGDPPLSAWGLYGPMDELGALNLLTPEVVLAAKSEIILGRTFSLNLPLNVPIVPMNPQRRQWLHHFNVKPFSNDDTLHINTQSSTHWDGLRHLPYQARNEGDIKKYYNGITQESISGDHPDLRLGVHNISRKAIAGRGVLLDYRGWADQNSIKYDAFSTHRIPLTDLLACAKAQGTSFQPGDILVIRSGWTQDYQSRSAEEQVALGTRSNRDFVGVDNSVEMVKWHWDMQFAAVAGDTNAYEAWPPDKASSLQLALHEVFLAGWGMPIGEVWNLEELAKICREQRRWTFFLTSQPLDIPGGVASPANVMAIL